MFSCVHKSTTTGIPVSNQSLQCGWSAITLYDGRYCVSSHSSPAPQSSSTWVYYSSSIRHLKVQWNGTFIIAVTEFRVICLQNITHFTTVSHNIVCNKPNSCIHTTIHRVDITQVPQFHMILRTAINHTVTYKVRTASYGRKMVHIYFSWKSSCQTVYNYKGWLHSHAKMLQVLFNVVT